MSARPFSLLLDIPEMARGGVFIEQNAPKMGTPELHPQGKWSRPRERLLHFAAIALATLALCWPAIWKGYPLLYPDSYAYVVEGRTALHAMLGHANAGFIAIRPEVYTASIYLLHWRRSPWPVIVLQAALAAWVLWLVVRSVLRVWAAGWYLAIVLVLCALTSAAWTAAWVLPDILGPVAYLAICLLLMPSEALSQREQWGVLAVACWCLCAHPSHLIVAALICAALGGLWLLRWPVLRGAGRRLAWVCVVVAMATLLPIFAHLLMYRHATMNETRPAFLLARLTADAPARGYLRDHCATLLWTVCRYQDRLTAESDEFLWAGNGVWQTAGANDRAAMLQEEVPLLLATLRSVPGPELQVCWKHFEQQFVDFDEFAMIYDAGWPVAVERLFPGQGALVARSRQGRNTSLPWGFERMLYGVVEVSAVVLLGMLPWVLRDGQMALLVTVVGLALMLNAAVTGVLSEVSWRYQSRVEWMVVLVALLGFARLMNERFSRPLLLPA